jgi:uncharacterized protein involved in propanediol utilization
MFGVGVAHGKFGELLQGALPGKDANFLVALPILRYSIAKFHCSDSNTNKIVYPPHKSKSATLVKKIMKYFNLNCDWELTIESELEEGKGLGSSTSDMIACARAVTAATGKNLPIHILLTFLKEIEPSDGIMYEGVVCFYHRNVLLHSQLGYLSQLMIVGVDEGGVVDTVRFNRELRPYTSDEKAEYATLLNEMISAIQLNDLKKIGAISTKSAVLHQALYPKKNLSLFVDICNAVEALGVVIAHSGTYIGIILDKSHVDHLRKLSLVEEIMKENCLIAEVFNSFSEKSLFQSESYLRTGSVY